MQLDPQRVRAAFDAWARKWEKANAEGQPDQPIFGEDNKVRAEYLDDCATTFIECYDEVDAVS